MKWLAVGLAILAVIALVGGRAYQVVHESDDLARYPAPGELIRVDDRLMHIHCIGDGSPTVVFELGVGSSSASWGEVHEQVALLTRSCRYDRAGLGYSEPTSDPLRSVNVAQRLRKLLLAAGIDDQLLLVGWSAGGVYAREFFRQFPDSVGAMLLVDSSHEQQAARMPQGGGGGAGPMLRFAKYLAPVGVMRSSGLLDRRVERGATPDKLKPRLKAIYNQSHILDTVWRESEAFDLDINSSRPPSPVGNLPLIVLSRGKSDSPDRQSAAHDRLQEELAALSSNGRRIIAGDSGHHIYADQPELVIESIRELIREIRDKQPNSQATPP